MIRFMRLGRVFVLCLITAAILSGCGRRGGLEPPPEAEAAPDTVRTEEQVGTPQPFRKKKVPDRPFVLDGLI